MPSSHRCCCCDHCSSYPLSVIFPTLAIVIEDPFPSKHNRDSEIQKCHNSVTESLLYGRRAVCTCQVSVNLFSQQPFLVDHGVNISYILQIKSLRLRRAGSTSGFCYNAAFYFWGTGAGPGSLEMVLMMLGHGPGRSSARLTDWHASELGRDGAGAGTRVL